MTSDESPENEDIYKGEDNDSEKKEEVVYITHGIMTYNHDDCDNVDNHNDGMTLLPPK